MERICLLGFCKVQRDAGCLLFRLLLLEEQSFGIKTGGQVCLTSQAKS